MFGFVPVPLAIFESFAFEDWQKLGATSLLFIAVAILWKTLGTEAKKNRRLYEQIIEEKDARIETQSDQLEKRDAHIIELEKELARLRK